MRAVIGSVVVHAVLGWLVVRGAREGRPDAPTTSRVAITVVEPVEVTFVPSVEPGGSSGAAGSASSGGSSAPTAPARAASITAAPASRARAAPSRSRRLDPDPRGTITIDDGRDLERADSETDDGTSTSDAAATTGHATGRGTAPGAAVGTGTGTGRGTGTGIGFGDGGSIQRPQLLVPPPAPRGDPPSKARPARLIYPTRQRDVEDADLFVARVIIDDDRSEERRVGKECCR